jgi:hypothetical protein
MVLQELPQLSVLVPLRQVYREHPHQLSTVAPVRRLYSISQFRKEQLGKLELRVLKESKDHKEFLVRPVKELRIFRSYEVLTTRHLGSTRIRT